MENVNKKYNLEIEVLTPLSIGVGAEKDLTRGVDFVVKNKMMYMLSLKKMQIAGVDIDKISNLIVKQDENGLLSELANKLEQTSDLIREYPTESWNPVKVTLKNELTGDALIAGSSLKGAVRSALYKYLGADKEEAVAFGDMKEGTDIMRFMKFSDADFKETELVNSKIFNLWKDSVGEWQGGWKNGMNNTSYNCSNNKFNTLYECIMPGEKGYGTLMLSATSYDLCERNAKSGLNTRIQPLLSKDLQCGLFEKINGYTKTYLLKEKAFYNKYSNNVDNADKILDSIDYLLEQIPEDNSSCVMKMSAGVGFHSVTGDWQFNDFSINGVDDRGNVSRGLLDGKPSAKSRKLAIYGNRVSPMGFVKIREIDAAEQFEVEKNRQKRREELVEQVKNSVEERRKTQESEKRLSENRTTYNKLIDEAVAFENKGDKKNAYEKYKKAAEIFPDGSRHSQKHIEELKKAVEIEINIEQAEAAAKQAEEERKEKAEEKKKRGLLFLLDKKVNSQDLKIDKWQAGVGRVTEFVEKNKYIITENDISNFVEWVGKISIVKKREKMDFEDRSGNSWKRLENVFGERTDEIFNSINNQ